MHDHDRRDSILKKEFKNALRGLKVNKAQGLGRAPTELKTSRKEHVISISLRYVRNESRTKDYKLIKTVTIQKIVGSDKCEKYLTISVTTHVSKILTKIIYIRIEQTLGSSLDENQFGFKKKRGTRQALLSLRLIQSGRLRVGEPTFIAFLDLGKAFENISWPKLFEILKSKRIDSEDRRINSSLYRDQKAMI